MPEAMQILSNTLLENKMLAIILGILKVICIILLILILLVLFILAIVLFVPIRYNGNGLIDKSRKEATVKVTWLLHALSVRLDYKHPDKPIVLIKLLGIDINKFKKKPKPPKPPKEKKDKKEKLHPSINLALLNYYDEPTPPKPVKPKEPPLNEEHKKIVEDYMEEKAKPKENLREKLNKIVNKITSVYNKVNDILANIQYYLELLQEEGTKALLGTTLDALIRILKKIRPRKLIINAEIGFDTPDTTGKLYGLFWAFKPALGEDVNITPNFEEKVLEGNFYFKGRITIFTILINGLRIVLNKNFKPFLKKIKNGGLNNGREAK